MPMRRRLMIGIGAAGTVTGLSAWLVPKVLRRMEMQGLRPVTLAKGLEFPWALAFLPDGRMLVTERPGRIRFVGADGALSEPLPGLLPVVAIGEGGLLDLALDPDFANNRALYWSFSEPADRKSTRLNSSHLEQSRMPSSA